MEKSPDACGFKSVVHSSPSPFLRPKHRPICRQHPCHIPPATLLPSTKKQKKGPAFPTPRRKPTPKNRPFRSFASFHLLAGEAAGEVTGEEEARRNAKTGVGGSPMEKRRMEKKKEEAEIPTPKNPSFHSFASLHLLAGEAAGEVTGEEEARNKAKTGVGGSPMEKRRMEKKKEEAEIGCYRWQSGRRSSSSPPSSCL